MDLKALAARIVWILLEGSGKQLLGILDGDKIVNAVTAPGGEKDFDTWIMAANVGKTKIVHLGATQSYSVEELTLESRTRLMIRCDYMINLKKIAIRQVENDLYKAHWRK